ncbi:response regulator [Brachybacterium saurashtrense]|uniref:DNA-binding response regulator n=1 Tax=Brachybacterium saurashtrense TaxID=556288 RepID=A0A345YJW1_9MICO|nr:response regulator transcription factor [Brachybacterium saurashtrense]AXK44213.1 DNA-binding response regulator [Brachybacterium saurashtrense]RRR21485.1 DNA-binding response regulator [Brachybacterium saurashtrense]
MSTPPIRVVVADDHPGVLSGLVALLDSAPDITVVGRAADGAAAVEETRAHRPDVVLTDVRMPGATGIEITPRLRALGASVLVISGFDLDEAVLGALGAGADGYLVKSEEPQRILAAVRDVHRGDAVLSAGATRTVLAALRGADGAGSGPDPAFTGREEDVLALVAQGRTNQQIASALFVEVSTVKSHLSHALTKLGLESRVQAALWWQRHRG